MVRTWLLLSSCLLAWPVTVGAGEDDVLAALVAASAVYPDLRIVGGVVRSATIDVPTEGPDAPSRATAFLERYGELFGVEDPSGLVVDEIRTDDRLVHVFFRQRHQGTFVEHGQLTVHLVENRVLAVNGGFVRALGPVAVPEIEAGLATMIAIEGSNLEGTVELVPPVLALVEVGSERGPETRLAWRVQVRGSEKGAARHVEVHVDALDGARLAELEQSRDIDLSVASAGGSTSIDCWRWFGTLVEWFDENGPTSAYSAGSDTSNDGQDAFDGMNTTYDWFDREVQRTSHDDRDGATNLVVDEGTANASYDSYCGQIFFGEGFAELDVVAHEFTHWVNHDARGLQYRNEAGALDESFADVFALLIDAPDSTIGEGLSSGSCGGVGVGAFRSASNPPSCGDPDHVLASVSGDNLGLRPLLEWWELADSGNDFGGVHTNSSIPNKAAWLLMEGGSHNGFTIKGIGRTKVGRLYYDVLTSWVHSGETFAEVRDDTVAQAVIYVNQGLHGFGSQDVCQIRNAFASVGIDPTGADVDCDGTEDQIDADDDGDFVPDVTDNCRTDPNWNQADRDGDGAGDPCDDDDDADGVLDTADNCPYMYNPDQLDSNSDGAGNACDDHDGDGFPDGIDNCELVPNPDQSNIDKHLDGLGDVCDDDMDGDGRPNTKDVCPRKWDNGADTDFDGIGDACDNCVSVANADQSDCDRDGVGAACDTSPDEQFAVIGCSVPMPVAMHTWVHPLDLVSLPACDGCTSLPEGWEITVRARASDGRPVRVIDERGAAVGVVTEAGLTFEPRLSMVVLEGILPMYYLQLAPAEVDEVEVEVELELEIEAGVR